MRTSFKTGLLAALLTLGTVAGASASTWDARHPRRVEVNGRLATQNTRIRQGVRDGEITRGQAARLHAADRAMRFEERADADVNGGHLTRGEQRSLNRQESRTSRAIWREKHGG